MLKKHGADDYLNILLKLLFKYDTVMSGSFSGFQKRICEIFPNATFYAAVLIGNINLIIYDTAKRSWKVQYFLETVQEMFNFFNTSVFSGQI